MKRKPDRPDVANVVHERRAIFTRLPEKDTKLAVARVRLRELIE
jgi:hypothetical protein